MSLLLILTLLMSLFPVRLPVLAAEINTHMTNSTIYGAITTGQAIYFGKNKGTNPIKWRVMETEEDKVTLISEYILEYRQYDPALYNNWSGSDICKYLNSQESYTDSGFLTTAFTTAEQGYIEEYSNVQEHGYFKTDTFTPNQKIVLPSVNEVKNGGSFGWKQDSDRVAQNAEGYSGNPIINKAWWLRSPRDFAFTAAYVYFVGNVNDGMVKDSFGVRPALKLNLSSVVLFTSVTDITAPAAITNVPNGTAKDHVALGLPATVAIQTTEGNGTLGVTWDVQKCTYQPESAATQTFTVNGKLILPNGVVKLADGLSLDTNISVTVNAAPVAPTIITTSLASGTVGAAYSQTLAATGDSAITWSIESGTLPAGISLNSEIGEISGIPTTAGTANFTVKASNGVNPAATQELSIMINPAPIPIVTFDSNGGSAIAPITNVPSGSTITLPTPTRADYSFKGWFEGTTEYTNTTSITKDVTLVAKWERISVVPAETYTVTFNSNGGSPVAPISDITSGSIITLPMPTRSDYSFKGWFAGSIHYTSATPITKDVTLTAKWEQITQGGGSGGSNTGSSGGGGSSNSAVPPLTAEQVISELRQKDKEAILQNFTEHMPYTSLALKLTLEQLRKFTNNKFTDKQLQELLDKPETLEKLGIDQSMLGSQTVLKPIKNAVFIDVPPTHWANGAIQAAAELGLAAGMPDGSFAPNAPLQVEDTFTFLDRVLLLHGRTDMKLSRSTVEKYVTDQSHWAFLSMASIGSKLSEETLKSACALEDQPLSRELLAQILYELTEGKLKPVKEAVDFEDIADSPYKDAINYCVRTGLLNGIDNKHMAPKKALTRAELMSVLIRLDEKLK